MICNECLGSSSIRLQVDLPACHCIPIPARGFFGHRWLVRCIFMKFAPLAIVAWDLLVRFVGIPKHPLDGVTYILPKFDDAFYR
jgi:hypothetical protein